MATGISVPYQETVRQKGSSKCPNHRQKDVVYVCQNCKILLCSTCGIKSIHKTHNLEELTVIAQEKKTAMLNFINQSENNTLPRLKEGLRTNDSQMRETISEFKTISSSMKVQGEKCKQEIDELIAGFTSICKEMEKNNLELLRHQKKDRHHRYDVVLSEVEVCKKALQKSSDVEIFDTDFDPLGSYTETNPPVLQSCQYTPCTTITDHLKPAIGILTTSYLQSPAAAKCQMSSVGHTEIGNACTNAGESTGYPTSCELLGESIVVSEFPCATRAVSLSTTQEDNLWILYNNRKTVSRVNDKGKTKQKIKLSSATHDICVSPETGRLWFCCEDGTIYEFQEPATAAPQFETRGEAFCLRVTNDGVIVGTFSSLTIHTVRGIVLHTITKEEQSDFLPALRISNCSVTGNIAVVHMSDSREYAKSEEDFPYNQTLHIAVYDRTLNHMFTYKGEGIRGQQPVTPETFGPCSIVYDSFGNLIMTDVKRKTIELLSGTGQYLRTLHTGETYQGAICIASRKTLWSHMQDDKGNARIKLLKYRN